MQESAKYKEQCWIASALQRVKIFDMEGAATTEVESLAF
jgi:hypothetical protein